MHFNCCFCYSWSTGQLYMKWCPGEIAKCILQEQAKHTCSCNWWRVNWVLRSAAAVKGSWHCGRSDGRRLERKAKVVEPYSGRHQQENAPANSIFILIQTRLLVKVKVLKCVTANKGKRTKSKVTEPHLGWCSIVCRQLHASLLISEN
jgi:hypothetical protein